jgi:hypothetical protein
VGVVVLNWNGTQDTLECLSSLSELTYPFVAIIVVDNGSLDDPGPIIREKFPCIQYVRTDRNLGISGGNNLGIRAALAVGCQYIVLMNNDTVVASDFLDHLVSVCEADHTVGIAGSMIMYYGEPDRIQVAGFKFADRSVFKIRIRNGQIVVRGEDGIDQGQFSAPEEVPAVSGCAMLIRRDVIETVGGQDPRFYIYFQDIDFCLRATRAGFRCLLVPASRVWHKGGRTLSAAWGANSPIQQYWYLRDLHLFRRRQLGLGEFLWQWTLLTARAGVAWAAERDRATHHWAAFRGSLAGLVGGVAVRSPAVERIAR